MIISLRFCMAWYGWLFFWSLWGGLYFFFLFFGSDWGCVIVQLGSLFIARFISDCIPVLFVRKM
jgi:hypothetical protein